MNLDFGLSMHQEQKLIMTQQMQMSIKILQLSSFELQEYIEKEIQENPLLEAKYDKKEDKLDYKEIIKYLEFDDYTHNNYVKGDDEEVSPFNFISNKKSLKEYLKEQIAEFSEKDCIKHICNYIIENIDSKGYLGVSTEDISKEIHIPLNVVEKALVIVQSLEPYGVGARDLKECLKIQLSQRKMENFKLIQIIDNHLEDIAENRYNIIGKSLNITSTEAQRYGDIIKKLQPKPSSGFYTGEEVNYIIPDAYVKKIGEKYYIIMNDDLVPRLMINNLYKGIINKNEDKSAVEYVKNRLDSAAFLIKSIENRKSTIYRVLESIVEIQREYFDYGERYLKPMTLKEIADSLNMHESTISRAIRDKYIHTSKGTIKIKSLFTTSIQGTNSDNMSSINVKKLISNLIDKEDKKNPLSDQYISDELKKVNVNISRRTVTKYREEMGIKSSKGRKRF
ncbi:RNA polymerase sigma-54 factor [Clostridium pascui]|uniref:RNA polymerase factor sigma-54 n=1 Tax=Clostridium pascui TaxID=46609 RepID=UPI00195A7909|nr:RNA polymerase factor sigma-54 [Clostridium pascui]MBM7870492.1 RNA polymerase sigma-54 factor [Clostridium pascui]